jgi:hypothetical protein
MTQADVCALMTRVRVQPGRAQIHVPGQLFQKTSIQVAGTLFRVMETKIESWAAPKARIGGRRACALTT